MIGTVRGMMRSKKEVAGLPAPIASFRSNASGVKLDSLKVLVEAQQDLHGYDKPWAGGGGKNLFDKTAISNNKWLSTTTGLEENASGYCVSDFIKVKGGQSVFIPTSGTSRRWFYDSNKNPKSYLNNSGNQAFTPTEDGYIRVTIQITGSTPVSLDTYQIEVGSSATSYEPYENICPITGWSGANVTRTGVNVWDEEWELGIINTTTGQNQASNSQIRSVNHIPVKPNTTYRLVTGGTSVWCAIETYKSDKSFLRNLGGVTSGSTFTTPTDCYYVRFYCSPSYGTTYNNDISINYPSTATAYKPYNGNTYTIQFGSTYYGGELDVSSGVLRVTHNMVRITTIDSIHGDGKGARVSISPYASGYTLDTNHFYCNMLKPSNYSTAYDNHIHFANAAIVAMYFSEVIGTTKAEWETYLANNELWLCYELATPFTIQLSPQQIEQLEENNIWADTGDVSECKYSDRVVTVLFSKG